MIIIIRSESYHVQKKKRIALMYFLFETISLFLLYLNFFNRKLWKLRGLSHEWCGFGKCFCHCGYSSSWSYDTVLHTITKTMLQDFCISPVIRKIRNAPDEWPMRISDFCQRIYWVLLNYISYNYEIAL